MITYRIIGILLTFLVVAGCNESSDLGMELLPTTDLIEVKNLVEKSSISSYTYSEGPVRTDEASKSLLGSLYDPVFGKTTIHFAAQFRLQDNYDYGTNAVLDSVRLYLYYRLMYGDTVTPLTFNVYELIEPLFADTTSATGGTFDYPYYQDVDLKAKASEQRLGRIEYTPVVKLDTVYKDTVYQRITIPIDPVLGLKLLQADSLDMINNDVFLSYFRGLYIEVESQTSVSGSILTLEAAPDGGFQGSALALYYNNDENRAKSVPDTLFTPFVISKNSARVNSIEHDYSGTPFISGLNRDEGNDSLIYVQSTGGLKSKIFVDGLSAWKDSSNVVINRAEVVFQVDTIASEVDKFPPPAQLLLTVVDENGKELLPVDYSFYPLYYGGYLNNSDYTYRFNITQQVQQMIRKNENYGFFLTTAHKNNEAKRVIIKGSKSQTGIRMVITYSKFLQ